jgi:hypothetical protein
MISAPYQTLSMIEPDDRVIPMPTPVCDVLEFIGSHPNWQARLDSLLALGYERAVTPKDFFERLDSLIDRARDSLEARLAEQGEHDRRSHE